MGFDQSAPPSATTPPPPDTPNRTVTATQEGVNNNAKMIAIRVQMLDDSITLFQVQAKAPGRILFDQVCKQLNLLEVDYFGLEYQDSNGTTYWLDVDKQMNHQAGLPYPEPLLRFCIKFYTPDPSQIEEEYTRYLFSLQIKRDLSTGQLQCNDNTAALMASYIVQAECGDYVVEDYPDHTYLSSYKFVPHQDQELEKRIMENHKKHVGQSPAEADLNLVETARRCELYGVKMHAAKDHEGVPLNLAVAHLGVIVFQNYTKINTFSWAKVRKLSFKRKKFLIKLHPEGYGYYKDTVEFYFEDRNQCKNFWKKCVEHHGFFRCATTVRKEREKRRLLSRGSSFRYSGKTQKEMQEYVRENFVKRQSFQRHVRNLHSSTGNVGQSISAQPLLPIADSALDSSSPSHEVDSPSSPVTTSPSSEAPKYQSLFANSLAGQRTTSNSINNWDNNRDNNANNNWRNDNNDSFEGGRQIEEMSTTTSTPIIAQPPPMRLLRDDSIEATLSPVSSKSAGTDTDTDTRKKRYPTDRAYFISKEILMTERTYKKDLEVINLWFRDEVSKEENMPEDILSLLFTTLDPIYELHCSLLKDIEQRMATWEGRGNAHLNGDYKKIGDILLRNFDAATTDYYLKYVDTHRIILEKLEQAFTRDAKFQQVYKDFESQKVCYLPLTTLILKPLHRILHYELLLGRLLEHYNTNHPDYHNTNMAMLKMQGINRKMSNKLRESENFVKLAELQRDLGGFENLLQPDREFLREGCLQKLSRKGYQQRMFFLFSDLLLYANRTTNPTLHFRVHGQLPLKDITIVDNEPRLGADFCFNVCDGKKAMLVSASTQEEKNCWMEEMAEAAQAVRERGGSEDLPTNKFMSLKSMSGSDDGLDRSEMGTLGGGERGSNAQRTNSSVHVCWHRNTTVSFKEVHGSMQNLLSGYLLRKFKNSNGWQKLWVVFTNSCLYFFKTFQDDFPLASLPLLGYTVNCPSELDNIQKDYVFKLQFKNHVYFFRAESQYTFDRWIEVLSTATKISDDFPVSNGQHY